MRRLGSLRRSIAIGSRWIVALLGAMSIISAPIAAIVADLPIGVTMFMLGVLAIAMSIQMARVLDIQRRLRKIAVTPLVSSGIIDRQRVAPVKQKATAPLNADVTPGNLLSGQGVAHLPTIAFDLTGLGDDGLRRAVDSVATHQLITASFKPVFIIDRAEFGVIRSYGYLAELLIPNKEWTDERSDREEYIRRRLTAILEDYSCTGLIRLGTDGLNEVGRAMIDRLVEEWADIHQVALIPRGLPANVVSGGS